jgi:hypothetical protein
VGVVAELEEHERGALVVGQALEVGQQAAQLGAAVDVSGQAVARDARLVEGDLLAPRPQHGQAAVAGDRVQPGLEADLAAGRPHGAVGGHEGVLQGVLGLLAGAEHVAAEREQTAVVAVEDQLEGAVVAGADAGDQRLVRAPATHARAGTGGEAWCCGKRRLDGHGRSTFASTRGACAGWPLA